MSGTRDRGMAVGPITWQEIAAYNAEALAGLSVWDKKLIRRIDAAVLAILTGSADTSGQIPVSDGKGVASLLKGLAAQKRKAKGDAPAAS